MPNLHLNKSAELLKKYLFSELEAIFTPATTGLYPILIDFLNVI